MNNNDASKNWSKGLLFENKKDIKDRKFVTSPGIQKLISEGIINIPYKCSECGCTGEWNGKKVTLELHHIDGNHFNNDPANLTYLCPNCHSQTTNFRSKGLHIHTHKRNIKKEIIDNICECDYDIEKYIRIHKPPRKILAYQYYIELLKIGIIVINNNEETKKRLELLKAASKPTIVIKKEKVIVKQLVTRIKDPDDWIKHLTAAEKKVWFDIISKTFSLPKTDPNYISEAKKEIEKECIRQRDCIRTWTGRHHTEDSKLIMSLKMKDISTGPGNYMTGKCWICNDSTKETKIISKNELETYINQGWRKGRFYRS